LLIHQIIVVS